MINRLRAFLRFRILGGIPSELQSNFIHLYMDMGWWGLYAGTTAAFLNVYATRAGASPAQIGLLSALPSAISLAISLPAGRFIRNVPAAKTTFWSAIAGRFLFLAYVFVPCLPLVYQVDSILWIAILFTLPSTVINISFNQFLMEAVPSEWRGLVVSGRIALFSMVSFAVTLLSGRLLSWLPFPVGYQVVFFIGFVGGIMTAYHIARVRKVAPPDMQNAVKIIAIAEQRRLLPEVDHQGKRYLRVIGLLFLFNMVNNMVGPLAPEVMVNRLHLSDGLISLGTALSNILVFLVSLFIIRITGKAGNRAATALGAMLVAGHAVALGLAKNELLYFVAAFIGGIGSGILSTAQYNYHLENVPERDRTVWLSWNLMLGNAALLLGSLGGPGIANMIGIPSAMLLFGLARLVMGFVIFKWG